MADAADSSEGALSLSLSLSLWSRARPGHGRGDFGGLFQFPVQCSRDMVYVLSNRLEPRLVVASILKRHRGIVPLSKQIPFLAKSSMHVYQSPAQIPNPRSPMPDPQSQKQNKTILYIVHAMSTT